MFTFPVIQTTWLAYAKIGATVAAAALMFAAGWGTRGYTAERDLAQAKAAMSDRVAQHTIDQRVAVEHALLAEREARAKEQALIQRAQEPANEDRTVQAPKRRANADRVRNAAAGLRDAAGAISNTSGYSEATGDPIDPIGSQAALASELLLTKRLFAECGEGLAEVAIFADASQAAGKVCERGWDAMTKTTVQPGE